MRGRDGAGDSGAGKRAHLAVRPPGDAVLAASLLEDGDAQTELRGWVRGWGGSGGLGQESRRRAPGEGFFLTRGERSRGPHGPSLRGRTLRATSLMGRWKLALSTSSVMLLDWPHPRFCDGEMRVGEFGGGDRRRLVAASSVARRARQHLRTAFAVHAGARLTGTEKKTVRFQLSASTRPDRRDDAPANPDPRKAREHLRPRSRHRGDGRGRPRARSGAYLGHLLSLVFCLAFDRETANVIFPSRSGYALCRQRRVGIDKRDACVCAMDGVPTPILGASDFLRACWTPAGR